MSFFCSWAKYLIFILVLKSDNANGLFGFSGPCLPFSTANESAVFMCPIKRDRGDADTVTVNWQVLQHVRGELVLATEDFVEASGGLVFAPGEREKVLVFIFSEKLYTRFSFS